MKPIALRTLKQGALLLGAVCLLATGCARVPPRPEPPVALDLDDPLLAQLLTGLDDLAQDRRAVRADAVLKLESPQGARRVSQKIVLERPAQLRMEIMSFLTTAAVLVSDGRDYDYFQSNNRYREQGPVHRRLLWDIAGVPLSLDQAVHFLLGTPPPRAGLELAGAVRMPDGTLRLDLGDADGALARRLEFDAEGQLSRIEDRLGTGGVRWEVGYDRHREVGGEVFAHTVDFRFPRMESRAVVSFRGVELNPEINDATFVLRIPGEGDDAQR